MRSNQFLDLIRNNPFIWTQESKHFSLTKEFVEQYDSTIFDFSVYIFVVKYRSLIFSHLLDWILFLIYDDIKNL